MEVVTLTNVLVLVVLVLLIVMLVRKV